MDMTSSNCFGAVHSKLYPDLILKNNENYMFQIDRFKRDSRKVKSRLLPVAI